MHTKLAPLTLTLTMLTVAPLEAQRTERAPAARAELKHLVFKEVEFESKALARKVKYGLYLPKDYDAPANKENRYPLVLWLHGMFEDHLRFDARGGALVLDQMIGEQTMPELVFVTVNGGRSSFYLNGKTSGAHEDLITQDLRQQLEATVRLRPEREMRALMGVSMGGFGALNIGFRNPQMFGVIAAHSAAIFPPDPEQLPERFKAWIKSSQSRLGLDQLFGNPPDSELWKANNPLHLAKTLKVQTLRSLRIYFDCGDQDSYGFAEPNQELHRVLEERRIIHDFELIEGGGHGWRSGYNEGALPDSLGFVAKAFALANARANLGGILGGGNGEAQLPPPDRKEPTKQE